MPSTKRGTSGPETGLSLERKKRAGESPWGYGDCTRWEKMVKKVNGGCGTGSLTPARDTSNTQQQGRGKKEVTAYMHLQIRCLEK